MDQKFSNINSSVPTTHFFVYKNNRYPFNLTLFSLFSDFFSKNHTKLVEEDNIKLVDDEELLHLQENAIQDFVNFCQMKGISQINHNNVLSLNYLAMKYNVHQLISITEAFISNNEEKYEFKPKM